jgi:hypothetical protein
MLGIYRVAAQLVASRAVLSSTQLVSSGRSVGIVRLRTKGHGVCFVCGAITGINEWQGKL